MGKVFISGSAGGTGSDDVTALRSNVLSGKTAVTADSGDEAGVGTMPSYGGTCWNRDLGVGLEPDNFYSFFQPGHYAPFDERGSLHRIPIARVQGAIGLSADKLLSGQKAGGLSGTATNDAVLDPAYLVEGYSGYDDGIKKNGRCKRLSGQTITPASYQQVVSCAGKYMTGDVVVSGRAFYQEQYTQLNTAGSDYFTDTFNVRRMHPYVRYTVPFVNIMAVILWWESASGVFTYVTKSFLVIGNSDSGIGGCTCYQYNRDAPGVILSNGTVKIPVYKAGMCTVFTIGY